jgi:cytidine deaminase
MLMKKAAAKTKKQKTAPKATPKNTPKTNDEIVGQLFEAALATREGAHAPYSKFKVGSALAIKGGGYVTGCNVENASYGATVCAERVAIWKAVSEGADQFTDIVIVTDSKVPASPCAQCLQVMAEFFEPDAKIWLGDLKSIKECYSFEELLPRPFGPKQLRLGN